MSIRLPSISKQSFTYVSVLVILRHTHSCIKVETLIIRYIIGVVIHKGIIHSPLVINSERSYVDSKIFGINFWVRVVCIEKEVVRKHKLLVKWPIVSSSIQSLRISSVTYYWLNRIEVCIDSELK